MTERPILFSGPMVRAILAGKKRQTRRVIKPQPESPRGVYDVWPEDTVVEPFSDGTHWGFRWSKQQHGKIACDFRDSSGLKWKCPYGVPGDVLWVKEAWGFHSGGAIVTSEEARPNAWNKAGWGGEGCWSPVVYKAGTEDFAWGMYGPPKWRSPLFMPRSASRLSLPLKSVRVERVQDISEEDCYAEGCEPTATGLWAARNKFALLWDSINGKTYQWASNPWVWCLSFERIDNAR